MSTREASLEDIPQLIQIRFAVKENVLVNTSLVTPEDCADYIINRGKGWVHEEEGKITGFAIVDLQHNNVWALFIHPDHESQGTGSLLHDIMLDWYFTKTDTPLWLATTAGTRAEKFYLGRGWKIAGLREKGEIKFEMTPDDWEKHKATATTLTPHAKEI
jgi:GNAT superfamily N-acetyltransferase